MKTNKSQNLKSIPTGHKQTELGIIPEDWKVSSIGDLCVIFGRIGFRGYTKADIVSQGQGVLSISPSNIFDGRTNFTYGTYITRQKYEESPEIKIFEDDILLVKTGSTYGKIALVKNLKEDATLNPQVVVFKRLKSPAAFLAYIMQSDIVQNQIEETIVGGAIPTLSQKVVLSYKIPLPTPREQLAIANVLSDTDALIIAIEQLIAKKQFIKTATMQQLLTGRTRLPQFSKHSDGTLKGHGSSELGAIPEDWQVVPFKDVLTIKHGKNQKEVESPSGQYPIYATGGQIGNATSFLFDKPSVLIGRKGTIDKPRYAETPFWTVDTLFYSDIKKDFCVKFIYYKFCMIDWMQYNEASGVPSLNAHTIENVLVTLPNLEEQTAIASILSDMDDELKALEQKLAKIRDLKQGMMQQLLTGRIRLPLEQQS